MAAKYQPPYAITPPVLNAFSVSGELLGRWNACSEDAPSPRLRRQQRIRSIQASLAIENNQRSAASARMGPIHAETLIAPAAAAFGGGSTPRHRRAEGPRQS